MKGDEAMSKKVGRPKVNPDYNPEAARDELAKAVAELYLHPESDVDKDGHATMKSLQLHFGLTMTKVRKLLVTAGVYHFYKDGVDMVEAVQELHNEGCTLEEIKSRLHISTGTANSFLPYKSGTYNADFTADDYDFSNVSADARRKRNQRKREKMKDKEIMDKRDKEIEEMKKIKAKNRAENEARHQANLERKKGYHERKAQRQKNDPEGYLWHIKNAREVGVESYARQLERTRDIYLRQQAGEVIPYKVGKAYIENDPFPEYQSSKKASCDFSGWELELYKKLRSESPARIAAFYSGVNVSGDVSGVGDVSRKKPILPIRLDDDSLVADLNDLIFALSENHKSEFISYKDVAAFDVLLEKLIYKLRFYYLTSPAKLSKTAADKMIKILKGVGTDDDVFPEYEIKMIREAVEGL